MLWSRAQMEGNVDLEDAPSLDWDPKKVDGFWLQLILIHLVLSLVYL